jgi:hypothetical protein
MGGVLEVLIFLSECIETYFSWLLFFKTLSDRESLTDDLADVAIIGTGIDNRINLLGIRTPSRYTILGHMDIDDLSNVEVVASQIKGMAELAFYVDWKIIDQGSRLELAIKRFENRRFINLVS